MADRDMELAAACLAGDPHALATLERELLTAARRAIAAIDPSPAAIELALQRLRVSLLVGEDGTPRLASFTGRGSLRAWVAVAGSRIALAMRDGQTEERASDWSGALAAVSTHNPELELWKRQYADAFAIALRDAVEALEPRLRATLRMSFVDGLSIDEIGTVYAVHRATAARWIHRACQDVFARTRALLVERLQLSVSELDRMTALVHSQLEVSLSQLLPAGAD